MEETDDKFSQKFGSIVMSEQQRSELQSEKQLLLAKAKRLEDKMLFVRAAETYLKLGMNTEAAGAYEKGSAFEKAAELFTKLGKKEDAGRCIKKRDAASTGTTWQDMQAEFQQDKGNPY